MRPLMSVYVPKERGRAAIAELQNVEWSKLATSLGPAGHEVQVRIPSTGQIVSKKAELARNLAALADEDPEEHWGAQDDVMELVYSQGATYASTHAVVPFWAAFLADASFPNRERLASDLLAVLAAWIEADHAEGVEVFRASTAHLEAAATQGPPLLEKALRAVNDWTAGRPSADGPEGLMEMSQALSDEAWSQRC